MLLRALDNELRVQVKAKDPNFDYKKMAFVSEASGQQQEKLIESAQNSISNAKKASLQAAFKLFATSLSNDQLVYERHRAALDLSTARTRTVLVHSLEARYGQLK